ncbi:hypothetical protein FRX31_017242 [Thalictrum thalictroides]|uniref:Uncharacterized protein n=1 Tax=Thalictrum thalictroides TaxID=46969 RepID=A0A7J6W839_THATH|nr:hypothetical protein FRX31_017242 [Thalictrum thalictroides]
MPILGIDVLEIARHSQKVGMMDVAFCGTYISRELLFVNHLQGRISALLSIICNSDVYEGNWNDEKLRTLRATHYWKIENVAKKT